MHSNFHHGSGVTPLSDHSRSFAPTPFVPGLADATEVPWGRTLAQSRGVYGFDSMDSRSRSFNLMRGRLLELSRKRNWRLFGVVSATPNVGKSFIAANLAAAVSLDPRYQTYLVDLDLRRGSIGTIFGIAAERGIRDYLEDSAASGSPPAFVLAGESLVVLPTVPADLHSAELLAGDRAQALLRAMRNAESTHIFFFDLPPIFANDDTATVTAELDAYILVAEEGTTTQLEIEDSIAMLGEQRLAGVILNKYHGGLISEGYGVESSYSRSYLPSEE